MEELKPLVNLVNARKARGWTQEDLANAAGLSRSMLSNIERGKYTPSLPVAYRIAKVLNTTIEYLFFNPKARKTSKSA